jgi:hypothetical protein
MTIHQNTMYIGVNSSTDSKYIESIDLETGTEWAGIATPSDSSGPVYTLLSTPTGLIAGGQTATNSGFVMQYIYGSESSWQPIANSPSAFGDWAIVNSLALRNDVIYAGGFINQRIASTSLTNPFSTWQGVWGASSAFDREITTLVTAPDGTLYAGGYFTYRVARLVCQ